MALMDRINNLNHDYGRIITNAKRIWNLQSLVNAARRRAGGASVHSGVVVISIPEVLHTPLWVQRKWIVLCLSVAVSLKLMIACGRNAHAIVATSAAVVQTVKSRLQSDVQAPLASAFAYVFRRNLASTETADGSGSAALDRVSYEQEYKKELSILDAMLSDFAKLVSSHISTHGGVRGPTDGSAEARPGFPRPESAGGGDADGAPASDAERRGELLSLVYHYYQKESVAPVTNMMRGMLSNSLLIQIQKMKVDSIAMLMSIDDVMQKNELTMLGMAAAPAIGFLYLCARFMYVNLLKRKPVDLTEEALHAKSCLSRLEICLLRILRRREDEKLNLPLTTMTMQEDGITIFLAAEMHREVTELSELSTQLMKGKAPASAGLSSIISRDELEEMRKLLQLLSWAGSSAESRMAVVVRMRNNMSIFK